MGQKIYNIIIIEDEEGEARQLAKALDNYPEFHIVAIVPTLRKAPKEIKKYRPDLLFLDIEFPDGKGFTMIDKLRTHITWNMKTVFYTAHDKYMLNAIRSEAFDYLLKPFDSQELDNILKKFIERKHEEEKTSGPNATSQTEILAPQSADNEHFIITMPSGDIRVVKVSDIGIFHYNMERRVWEVLFSNQEWVPLRSNLKPEQIINYSSQFIRIHKSYIINISYLAMIHDNNCLMYPPFNKIEIPISTRYRHVLKLRFRTL